MSIDFYAAFVIGLMGAGHCLGMCGGVAAALTMGMPNQQKNNRWHYLLMYNLGRLLSYTIAGGIIGGAFAGVATLSGSSYALISLRLFASVMMIILALYLGQWWQGLVKIEKVGHILWKRIAPKANTFLPLKSPMAALPFGVLWGWLPCGLVYSTLSWAAVSGSLVSGSLVMLAFGLGTLPAMLVVGGLASQLKQLLSNLYFKRANALLLLGYGIHTGYIAINQIM
ncbi:sulfite exporter TauE/SafE family protein [Photobacterium sanguinicancri]|uniref:Cytochrome biogenesis protein n=1 Tax=Photobacterium sanguinicancri TaxID=875932 RepID=A0AAW7Y9Y0_9GAMM|nr:sulfite exporter TauE/SafE family protein [Photobacterium sanguinicancri]MDO6543460.1 sulfite exporter TauE/SafE family protein [Photobacterium sanguinicancri]OZS43440.1 cytochrome biogenesis protein [Photobacterium sanguinicancri]